MDDATPRPMPASVCARGRTKQVDLRGILEALPLEQQQEILTRFVAAMVDRYGDAWVPVGKAGKEQRISQRVKSFKKNIFDGIELVLSVPDYDREDAGRVLAIVMDPYWLAWWESSTDVSLMLEAGKHVLSDPQLRWLAAQYARSVFGSATPANRGVLLATIEAAEGHALGCVTDEQLSAADRAADRAASSAADWAAYSAAYSAADWAAYRAAERAADSAASSAAAWAAAWAASWAALAGVTRSVMAHCAPSLVRGSGR